MIELLPPPELILPPKPAIIRPGQLEMTPIAKAGFVLTQRGGFMMRARPPVDITQLVAINNTADQSSYSFSSYSFGAEHRTRRLFFWIFHLGAANQNINSMSAGGVSGTRVAGTSSSNIQGFIVDMPPGTGTSGTVQVNFSGTRYACAIAGYRLLHLISAVPVVATSTSNVSVATKKWGVALGASFDSTSSTSVTWSGLTEQFDTAVGTAYRASAAWSAPTDNEEPRSITATGHDLVYGAAFR